MTLTLSASQKCKPKLMKNLTLVMNPDYFIKSISMSLCTRSHKKSIKVAGTELTSLEFWHSTSF